MYIYAAVLFQAMEMLSDARSSAPIIFLVTDGSVENERQICDMIKNHMINGNIPSNLHSWHRYETWIRNVILWHSSSIILVRFLWFSSIVIFLFLHSIVSSLTLFSFFVCVLTDPGHIPSSYVPDVEARDSSSNQIAKDVSFTSIPMWVFT